MRSYLPLLSLLCAAALASAQPRVHYVRAGATGTGASWADARGSLAVALDSAVAGDEVWVAAGTYAPSANAGERSATFRLASGVRLRGGFAGEEASPSERPATAAPTVLSGYIGGAADSTHVYTILTAVSPGAGTLVERVHFVGGRGVDQSRARGYADPIIAGAQVDILGASAGDTLALAFEACRFEGARADGLGGAIYVDARENRRSGLRFTACEFVDNRARQGGGAVYIGTRGGGSDGSSFVGCGFRQNTAGGGGGGAIYWLAEDGGDLRPTLRDCDFDANGDGTGHGGAVRVNARDGHAAGAFTRVRFRDNFGANGGAVYLDCEFGGAAELAITEAVFARNRSAQAGGALYVDASDDGLGDVSVVRSAVYDNRANHSGGALYFNGLQGEIRPTVRDCRVEGNAAGDYGGAIYNFGRLGRANPLIVNTLIARNRAYAAGGMYSLGSDDGEAKPLIVNCAFVNNRAQIGGALYANAASVTTDSTGVSRPTVYNTIFQGNDAPTGHTLRNVYGGPVLYHNSFDRPACGDLLSGLGAQHTCADGNLFGVGDVFVDTAAHDYRLRAGAPVLDVGDVRILDSLGVGEDALQHLRSVGSAPDFGPLELDTARSTDLISAVDTALCVGTDLALSPDSPTRYPVEVAWTRDGELVSTADTLALGTVDASAAGRYRLTVRGWGPSVTDSIDVSIADSVATSLAVRFPEVDTFFVGTEYEFVAVAEPAGAVSSIEWRGVGSIGDEATYRLRPVDTGRVELEVLVNFQGRCLDTTARELVVGFDVSPLTSGLYAPLSGSGYRLLGNPVGERLRVGGLTAKPVTARIYSIDGRLVAEARLGDGRDGVDARALAPGVYALELRDGAGRYVGRFVKE